MIKKICYFSILWVFIACNSTQNKQNDTLFKSLNSDKTGVDFENKIIDTKMMNIFSYRT